jgi:hypothetical protein
MAKKQAVPVAVAPRAGDRQVVALKKAPMEALLNRLERPGENGESPIERRTNAAFGCKTSEAALHVLAQLVDLRRTAIADPAHVRLEDLSIQVTAMMGELDPRTGTETLLASQMIGAQGAAIEFLRRASRPCQPVEMVDRHVVWATKLMRVFLGQCEAMAKLKGMTGQQRVVVEHVTVNEGGKAIVGA